MPQMNGSLTYACMESPGKESGGLALVVDHRGITDCSDLSSHESRSGKGHPDDRKGTCRFGLEVNELADAQEDLVNGTGNLVARGASPFTDAR